MCVQCAISFLFHGVMILEMVLSKLRRMKNREQKRCSVSRARNWWKSISECILIGVYNGTQGSLLPYGEGGTLGMIGYAQTEESCIRAVFTPFMEYLPYIMLLQTLGMWNPHVWGHLSLSIGELVVTFFQVESWVQFIFQSWLWLRSSPSRSHGLPRKWSASTRTLLRSPCLERIPMWQRYAKKEEARVCTGSVSVMFLF